MYMTLEIYMYIPSQLIQIVERRWGNSQELWASAWGSKGL